MVKDPATDKGSPIQNNRARLLHLGQHRFEFRHPGDPERDDRFGIAESVIDNLLWQCSEGGPGPVEAPVLVCREGKGSAPNKEPDEEKAKARSANQRGDW